MHQTFIIQKLVGRGDGAPLVVMGADFLFVVVFFCGEGEWVADNCVCMCEL